MMPKLVLDQPAKPRLVLDEPKFDFGLPPIADPSAPPVGFVPKASLKDLDFSPERKSLTQAVKHGYRRAGTMMVKQLAGLSKMAGEFIEPGAKAKERPVFPALTRFWQSHSDKMKEWSDMMLGGVQEYYDQNPQEAIQIAPNLGYLRTLNEYVTKPQNLLQGLVESSPLMLEGILGTMTGGTIWGITAMGVPISGEVYADARKQGTEPLPAMAQAVLTGTGEAAIEQWTLGRKLGLLRNFRKIVAGGLPKILWESTKAFFRGTAEEGSQELNRNFWQWVFTDRSQPWLANIAESMAAGGPMEMTMAGMFSTAGAAGSMVSNDQKLQRVEKIRTAVKESPDLSKAHKAEIDKELDNVSGEVQQGKYDEMQARFDADAAAMDAELAEIQRPLRAKQPTMPQIEKPPAVIPPEGVAPAVEAAVKPEAITPTEPTPTPEIAAEKKPVKLVEEAEEEKIPAELKSLAEKARKIKTPQAFVRRTKLSKDEVIALKASGFIKQETRGKLPDLRAFWQKVQTEPTEPEAMAEGEVEVGAELGTESPAFNKHLDYFQSKQLPETSKIRDIQKAIRVINGKRLAGKITPQQANKRIVQLRKQLYQVAQKEGVSVRMTKGGKVLLAVRKAGTYAPEEFSQYGKFQNIYPLGQDITRSVQQIDGALSIKEKVHTKGQAGAVERYVLWPTREMSKQKLEYIKEKSVQLKKVFQTKRGTKEDAQINEVLEKIAKEDRNQPIKKVLSDKTIKAMAVKPSVVKQAMELRKFYDDLIEEQNQARKMRDQDPIPYRRNYSPHILRDVTIWERLMMRGQKPEQVISKMADLPDYIKPNKPFNPREMAREAGIPYEERVRSAVELAQSYLVTAAKDIFNTSIIQNNKAFIQQLEAMGYDKPAKYLGNWTAEAYAGITPALDRSLQLTQMPKTQKGMRWFNQIRNLAVFPLNFSWNLLTQTSSLALTVGRYGTVNTTKGFYQWLKPSIRKQAAEDYYSYIVKSAKQGRITHQDAQNLIGETVKLRRTTTELARDISTYFLEQLEKLLTGTSIRAAHLHGAKRGLTGEALKNYASDGGAKTQSMYNDEDKPALLRSVAIKTTLPYQTFAYEVMNTLKEWAGRTGTPPDSKLYTIWTVLRFLAAASVFAAIAKKGANKEVWSWKRPPIPFAELWLSPIIKYFTGQWLGSAAGLTSPIETAGRFAKGLKDVLETGSWRKLRNELIKYGPGVLHPWGLGMPGGVQWSRMVDAIIAYSQGGVKDRRGRLLFKMEDPQDLVQGIFSGVWSTKGGREYIEKRTGESGFMKYIKNLLNSEEKKKAGLR